MNRPPVKVCVKLLHLDKVEGLVVVVKFFVNELVDMVGLAFHFDIALPGHQIWSKTQSAIPNFYSPFHNDEIVRNPSVLCSWKQAKRTTDGDMYLSTIFRC